MWPKAIKHFESELVQDKETTMIDVNWINFYANFKFLSLYCQWLTNIYFRLEMSKRFNDNMYCLLYSKVFVNLNKMFHILIILTQGIVHFASAK